MTTAAVPARRTSGGGRRSAGALVLAVALVLVAGNEAAAVPRPEDEPTRTDGTRSPAPPRTSADEPPGSLPVGTARYRVPGNALHVAPGGDDAGAGNAGEPWRTIAHAVEAAPAGATVVVHGGSYPESVTIPLGKRLTLQSAPGEEVWLDGSHEVEGWTADGTGWRVDGWQAEFDSSPTYTTGAPDNTAPGWSFLDPAHPMAAHPDMLFVDGVPQEQVGSRADVRAGSFYVDDAGDRLYLGTDPTGHEVRASVLAVGLTVHGAGSVVRGIGVRRYATPVPDKGAIRSYAPDVTVENVVVRDNATQGMYVGGRDGGDRGVRNTLRHVTAEGNGMLGIESSFSDGLVVEAVRVTGNNTEGFNQAPVSGGVKICSARNLRVTGSVFADNRGTGLWFDESVHGVTVAGNDVLHNAGHGIAFEISSQVVIADNLVLGNEDTGLKVNNASRVEIWNNTVVDNGGRPLWVVQDARVAADPDLPGHDPRRPVPDPTVTWLLGPVTIANNVVGGGTSADCLLCVEDSALGRSPGQIGLAVDGNVWFRPAADAPAQLASWPAGRGGARTFATLELLASATGQEAHGAEFTATGPVLDEAHRLTDGALAAAPAVARYVPGWIAGLSGLSGLEPSPGVRRG